jgi:protein HIRA/HIR1
MINMLTRCACPGSNEAPPVENWRIFRRLIGHDNDVQDLGWSYDGSILVSVGLDSKVVVWSGHTFEKLKTLSNHQSHVKGLTFDPANKYFATTSDDRTMKIFRFTSPGPNSSAHDQMNNFVLETTITAPFASSPLTTYFRRCSWGPDGQNIAAANAVNGPVSSVAIINRGTWDGDNGLIGHEAPVEVCAFSPRLYRRLVGPPGKEGQAAQHITVIACGGADKCLSVWTTSSPRPLVVTQDMSGKPISDLAWSPDGMSLFVTSLDGSIVTLRFDEAELGRPQEVEENERSLAKYGTGRKGVGISETPDGLLLEEKSKAGELKGVEGRMGALMGDVSSSQPAANIALHMNGDPPTKSENGINAITNGEAPLKDRPDPNQAKLERLKQRVEITKDGKKRIKPLLVSGTGAAESSLPQARLVNPAVGNQTTGADVPQSILDLSKPFDGLPKGGLATLLLGNKRRLAQLDNDDDGHMEKKIAFASRNGATPIVTNGADGLLPAQVQPIVPGQQPTPEFIRPAVLNPVLSVSQLRLAVPKVRSAFVQAIDGAGNAASSPSNNDAATKSTPDLVFEARNPPPQSITGRPQDREPARITLSRRDQTVWQDFLPRTILLATGNKDFWAVADEAGSINIWTSAGRRLVNPFVLEAQPVILESKGPWLLCITAVGLCHVWNIRTMSSPHPPVSMAPVLDAAVHSLTVHPTSAPAITDARLNSEGRIIVSLSNGDGYAYSPQMYTWQRLSEVWWAVGSQYWNTTDSSVANVKHASKTKDSPGEVQNISAGIIPFLERNTTNETLLRGRAYFLQRLIKVLLSREGFESFESGISIAHLENRVAAALMLRAREEFRLYLLMYAKRLGAEGLRGKVEELLRTLLGGITMDENSPPEQGNERTWQDNKETICGWERNVLLKDVVLLLGKLCRFA